MAYGQMYQPYGNSYGQNYGMQSNGMYPAQGQQGYSGAQQQAAGIVWVDGEVGAKAFQLPAGVLGPVALWDMNEPVIYLKSINQMGMPNPLQKARYKLEEAQSGRYPFQNNAMLPSGDYGQSGQEHASNAQHSQPDMSEYVKKEDFERMKHELTESINNLSANGGTATARKNSRGE